MRESFRAALWALAMLALDKDDGVILGLCEWWVVVMDGRITFITHFIIYAIVPWCRK